MRGARLLDAQRNLVRDANAVTFERDDLFRVIRKDTNVLEAKASVR